MREIERTRSRSFTAKTPAEFDKQYNRIADELTQDGIVPGRPEKDGSMYHVFYSYTELVPENAKEMCELDGRKFYCKDCPYFDLGKNNKCKSVGCTLDIEHNAVDYTPACEMFYNQYAKGEVKPRGCK